MCCDHLDDSVTPTDEQALRQDLAGVLILAGDTAPGDEAVQFVLDGLLLEKALAEAERRLLDEAGDE